MFIQTKSIKLSKAVRLFIIFVTNRPFLKENLNTVHCTVFSILMDCKHNLR